MTVSPLQLRHVSHSFGTLEVLRDLSIEVIHREFVAIVGPSGCGKTTLLNLLSGFDHPTSGSIERKGKSRMVHQQDGLFPWQTVSENIALGLRLVKSEQERRQQEEEQRPAHRDDEQGRGGVPDQDVLEHVRREQLLVAHVVERRDERKDEQREAGREERGEREYSEPTEHGALISKRPTHGASRAAVRRTLLNESAISSRTHALFGLRLGVLDCSGRWHRTCFHSDQKQVGPLEWARNGPGGHRVSSLRPIGVAEGRKWEKSNDFNGSERSFGPNSLDLPRHGPLY